MATIFDNRTETAYTPVREDEATIHNANIKEKYRQLLQSAEEDQLSESFSRAERSSSARASVLSPERPSAPERVSPSFQPAPFRPEAPAEEHVTVHTRVDSPLFTPEMLERTMRGGEAPVSDFGGAAEMYAPAAEMYAAEMPAAVPMAPAVAEMPVAAVNAEAAEESYGLSAFAIRMIAAFAAAVVMLLTVIGINSPKDQSAAQSRTAPRTARRRDGGAGNADRRGDLLRSGPRIRAGTRHDPRGGMTPQFFRDFRKGENDHQKTNQ